MNTEGGSQSLANSSSSAAFLASEPSLVPGASRAVVAGEEFAIESVDYDAVLLAGFGGPEGQDEVIPFLKNVTRGRGVPESRLEEVARHYRRFGGISPINEHNRQLRQALETELSRRGYNLPVLWGNRNWKPYIKDALLEAKSRRYRQLLTLATSAYSCYSSCRQYREDLASAAEAAMAEDMVIDKVRLFFDHPGLVYPFLEGLIDGYVELRKRKPSLDLARVCVAFSTHSIPTLDASLSGPRQRVFDDGGAYVAQHRAVARVIMDEAKRALEADSLAWRLVYQSRSGPPSVPWLEPDINDVIKLLPSEGFEAVLIVPLGFVSDHMEVLWDLDNEAMDTAKKAGLMAVRTPTPGTHPKYVSGLVDLIEERLLGTPAPKRPALTELGPWYDVCRPGCCENKRLGFRSAYAGLRP